MSFNSLESYLPWSPTSPFNGIFHKKHGSCPSPNAVFGPECLCREFCCCPICTRPAPPSVIFLIRHCVLPFRFRKTQTLFLEHPTISNRNILVSNVFVLKMGNIVNRDIVIFGGLKGRVSYIWHNFCLSYTFS